jgi:serine/threonine-protein kinase
MAKICRARYLGDTASKICAIKMVQPQYSKDESFKQMFMDEIKVTFGLLHPNIIQTYDYGVHNSQLYVAMEYCDGRNLKEYLDKLKERKFVFPVEISVYIVTQACQALHYAHTLTDKLTGQKLRIIHRDISPHNIMLTYDGSVKVIDFGIAKADTNSEATQAGTIKGKLSYLAPEYLEGKELDPRYDEFAIGITLWEMLCSRKLFKAPNDLAVLKKIQECKVPLPSSINPNVPKELDEIVMKALHKDRSKRYEDLDKMNRALMKFLYSHYPDFNATDLAYFAKELFKEEIQKDREKMFAFGKIELAPYIDELKRELAGGTDAAELAAAGKPPPVSAATQPPLDASAIKATEFDFGFQGDPNSSKFTEGGTRVVNRKELLTSKTSKTAASAATSTAHNKQSPDNLALGSVARKKVVRNDEKTKSNIQRPGTPASKNAKTRTNVNNEDLKAKSKPNFKMIGAAIASVVVIALVMKTPGKNDSEVEEVVSERKPSSQKTTEVKAPVVEAGMLFIRNFNKYKQKAYLNGVELNVDVVGEVKGVALGKEHVLRVEYPGFKHFIHRFTLSAQTLNESVSIPELPNVSYGHLMMGYGCAEGKLIFNLFGEDRVETLPFKDRKSIAFPLKVNPNGESLPTEYEIFFEKKGESFQRKVKFTLNFENDSIDFCAVAFAQATN